jgi:hypothetical protein
VVWASTYSGSGFPRMCLSSRMPCSVSTSRSSNRTGSFSATLALWRKASPQKTHDSNRSDTTDPTLDKPQTDSHTELFRVVSFVQPCVAPCPTSVCLPLQGYELADPIENRLVREGCSVRACAPKSATSLSRHLALQPKRSQTKPLRFKTTGSLIRSSSNATKNESPAHFW